MNLTMTFHKTWQDVETAYTERNIQDHTEDHSRNQAMLAFVFCKSLESRLNNLHFAYDARLLPDQSYRPNFIIWADEGKPIVIFMGDLKFRLENETALKQGIKDLTHYANSPSVEVLSNHDSTKIMDVSLLVEFGCFVISDLALSDIRKGITSLGLSQHELTKFHFAYGSVNGHSHFDYQEPRSMRI